MTDLPPPYRPLRGAEPPHFVDRHDEDDIDWAGIVAGTLTAYRAGPADPRFHRLVWSEPALGKTALLRAARREVAARLGWAVVAHRCRPKERAAAVVGQAVLSAVDQAGPGLVPPRWMAVAQHPSLRPPSPPAHAGLGPGAGDELSWSSFWRLVKVAGWACRSTGTGLMVTLDDADRLGPGELEAFGHLARALAGEGLPVAFLFAGGPKLAERSARAGHFRGCVWPTRLATMDDAEAGEALVVPAAERGVDVHEDAVELLCQAAGGSPLDLQRLAFTAWSVAARRGVVSLGDAERALTMTCAPAQRQAS